MTPPPTQEKKKKELSTKSSCKKNHFSEPPPKNIEIQDFEHQKWSKPVCMKISEYPQSLLGIERVQPMLPLGMDHKITFINFMIHALGPCPRPPLGTRLANCILDCVDYHPFCSVLEDIRPQLAHLQIARVPFHS